MILVKGCSDLSIKNVQVIIDEADDGPSTPPSSGDEAIVEVGRQADVCTFPPPKLVGLGLNEAGLGLNKAGLPSSLSP